MVASGSGTISFPVNTNSVFIGLNPNGTSLSGSMDEVRIWNTVRTQCQIQQFMNCEITSTASGLVANYHFNQGIPARNKTRLCLITLWPMQLEVIRVRFYQFRTYREVHQTGLVRVEGQWIYNQCSAYSYPYC